MTDNRNNKEWLGLHSNNKSDQIKQLELEEIFNNYRSLGIRVQQLGNIVQNPVEIHKDDIKEFLDLNKQAHNDLVTLEKQVLELYRRQ